MTTFSSYEGADSSSGGDGNDLFDYVSYSTGVDTLTGGAGQDTYKLRSPFSTGNAASIVTDFTVGAGGDLVDIDEAAAATHAHQRQSVYHRPSALDRRRSWQYPAPGRSEWRCQRLEHLARLPGPGRGRFHPRQFHRRLVAERHRHRPQPAPIMPTSWPDRATGTAWRAAAEPTRSMVMPAMTRSSAVRGKTA
jgi:hypothetical protein